MHTAETGLYFKNRKQSVAMEADPADGNPGHTTVTRANSGNKRLHIDTFELKLAREVERLLFPRSSPTCTWNCIGVKNRTAGVLGGDYFDFVSVPDGGQAVFIGDVTGHGLHASLVMSLIYGFIHRAALDAVAPSELAAQVNDFLLHFAERSRTVDLYFSTTLFFGVIELEVLQGRGLVQDEGVVGRVQEVVVPLELSRGISRNRRSWTAAAASARSSGFSCRSPCRAS